MSSSTFFYNTNLYCYVKIFSGINAINIRFNSRDSSIKSATSDKIKANESRFEEDSMGSLEVPIDALYGAQTQRAINNFTVSDLILPENFIRALLRI